jgi:hypothetical protein
MNEISLHSWSSAVCETASLDVELRDRYLRVTGKGLWSAAFIDSHFGGLQRQVAAMRALHGHARVLVNLCTATIQTPETAERIRHWTGLIYKERDRVAIVLASSLLKSQMRRVTIIADRELFLSETNALAWLLAA